MAHFFVDNSLWDCKPGLDLLGLCKDLRDTNNCVTVQSRPIECTRRTDGVQSGSCFQLDLFNAAKEVSPKKLAFLIFTLTCAQCARSAYDNYPRSTHPQHTVVSF